MVITSTRNDAVRFYVKLRTDGGFRREKRLFILEGVRQSTTALEYASDRVATLIVREDFFQRRGNAVLERFVASRPGDVISVNRVVFQKLSDTRTPQGVMAVVRMPEFSAGELWNDPRASVILILDGVQDPGNAGTLIRSAAAFSGCPVLCLDGTADPYNAKVARASAGGIVTTPVMKTTRSELLDVIAHASIDRSVVVAGADGLVAFPDWRPDFPVSIVIGGEASGVSDALKSIAGDHVSIPIRPEIDSLNAAVAGSILLQRIAGA